MFKNLLVYRVAGGWNARIDAVEQALQEAVFTECSASQEKSVGWVPPRGEAHGALVERVDGQWLMRLMVETKAVPAAVVKRKVAEQVAQIEATTGRKPGKKEARDLRDDVRQSLLPLAFQTVIVSFVSYLVWFWLLRHYPATQAASFTLLTPIFGLFAGAWILSEPVTARLLVALATVAGGIALVNRR